ncbi:MAG: HAD hydrolase-like protein [Spirochaetes bacterium]|nr:HAD hydrolase-like protein [Spirochaetota bacterium]
MELARSCLVIDHDDTAVMSTPLIHYPAHVEAMRRLRPGVAAISLDGWFRKNFHPGLNEFLCDELGMSDAELAESQRIWREFTASRAAEFFPGMLTALCEFKRRGGVLVVVSHSDVGTIERDYRAAAASGLGAVVPDLVFGWDEDPERRKPHPWPVLETMSRFGFKPGELLVLDDLKPGADMAYAAGVDFAAAGWGHAIPEIRAAFRERCFRWFETVGDFSGYLLGC